MAKTAGIFNEESSKDNETTGKDNETTGEDNKTMVSKPENKKYGNGAGFQNIMTLQ